MSEPSEDDPDAAVKHLFPKKTSLVMGLIVLATVAGAIPVIPWTGNVVHYNQKIRGFLDLSNSTDCTSQGGVIYANYSGRYTCGFVWNETGYSWDQAKVGLWYCLLHGGCW